VRRLAFLLALAAVCVPLAAAAPEPVETKLPRPPFPATTSPSARAGQLDLAIVSSQRNAITDEAAWLRRNGLRLREYRVPGGFTDLPLAKLPALPTSYPSPAGELRLVRAISQQDGKVLLVYGKDFASGRYVVGTDLRTKRMRYAYDFGSYAYAPVTAPGDRDLVYQQVVWAAETVGTLYVATSHSTYASSSGGLNAYLSAIDLKTRKLKWRSGPLVANAGTFEIVGGTIVTGYGFTAEPDYLYVLDRTNGKVIARTSVPSGPEFIIRKGSLLYVRTYDHDLVVKLVRP
jgi:hypothetical protein